MSDTARQIRQSFHIEMKFNSAPLNHAGAAAEWKAAMQDLERCFWNWVEGVNAYYDATSPDQDSTALMIDALRSTRVVAAEAQAASKGAA